MKTQLDIAIHLTCETYSSGQQLREYPHFSRHIVGAIYLWLLKIPDDRYQKFILDSKTSGFHKAILETFDISNEAQTSLKHAVAEFLPRFSYDHGRLAEKVISVSREISSKDEAFEYVFEMFDQAVGSGHDKAVWDLACQALCTLPES
ncbi:MAG: hypothetical protein U1E10_01525 [Bdellovibrionales bacterium]|nr:hypothetical protein [Bdellovibrionales bacterium]